MKYKYYDPLLDCLEDEEPDTKVTIGDIVKLEEESESNGDLALASIDYELHFGLSISFGCYCEEGYDYTREALLRGGSVAVYRECIKRNLDVDQLFETGFVTADKATKKDWDSWCVSGQRTIEKAYRMPHEECIVYLKKKRAEILEWQRQRQQAQQ